MDQEIDWEVLEFQQKNKGKGRTFNSVLYSKEVADMYEESLQKLSPEPKIGEILSGIVINKSERYATVDVNWRESVYIDLDKEDKNYLKYIQEGYELDLIVQDSHTNTYNYIGSYSELVREKLREEIKNSIGEKVAYPAKVISLIHGGYFLDIDGVEVFMPGSVAGMNKLTDFESLLGQILYVCPINYSKDKNYIVVSHREYLKTQVPGEVEKLEEGLECFGFVTGTTKFGIFVEFNGCLTALIHKSELDEDTIVRFNSRSIKPGDEIEFKIKEVIDDYKIICTQKEFTPESELWDNIDSMYQVPCDVDGKVRKVANFGVFIEIEPKISGLLHKTEIPENVAEMKEGDSVQVKLYKIDKEAKKLFFKI
tara:strand:+ start:2126 stop:3229 length:1104 start_codon:yes stop_codon:yes gene_type:complete